MKYLKYSLVLIIVTLLGAGCNNEIEDFNFDPDDAKYFPLKIGNTWTYQLDSTIFDNGGTTKINVSSVVIEKITESFKDASGETNYLIEQTIIQNGGIKSVKYLNTYATDTKVVRNEGNLKFIKLIFPAFKGKTWDGNALFDSENTIVKIAGEPIKMYELWEYRYEDKGINKTIDGKEYKDVLSVIQTDTDIPIQKRYSVEDYAKGIGLVYKKMMILDTQKSAQTSTPWELKAEEGFILEQKLLSFEIN